MSLPNAKQLLQKRGRLLGAMLAAIIAVVVVVAYIATSPRMANGPRPAVSGEYAGSRSCKECHEEVYNGWRSTFHSSKFLEASPETVIGDFTRDTTHEAGDVTSTVSRKGDAYFMTTAGPEGAEQTYRIAYVVGSIWKQRYITRFPNGALHVLPLQWNVATLDWTDYHGAESAKPGDGSYWSDKERIFQYQCMGCHTTNAKLNYDAATDTYETTWDEFNVGCEACHGPGADHIAAPIPDKAATILNPARLPDPRRAAMICGSCHTRGHSRDGKFAYPVGYEPGDHLNFLFDTKPGVYPDGSPKNHHQQYDDWRSSGHEAAGVMCWDCHSPHIRGKSNRFQLKLPGSLLCTTCHTVEKQGVHSLHSTSNCIGCHMPNTVKSATPGDLRSHRFAVVRPELTVKKDSDVEVQPNSCNLCHYHRDYDPERLVHFLQAVKKPDRCKACHYHAEQDPEDEE